MLSLTQGQRAFSRTTRSLSCRSTSCRSASCRSLSCRSVSYDLAGALQTINHIVMDSSLPLHQKMTRLVGLEDPAASPRKRPDKVRASCFIYTCVCLSVRERISETALQSSPRNFYAWRRCVLPALEMTLLLYTAHKFNGPLSGTTRVSRYRKGKNQSRFN